MRPTKKFSVWLAAIALLVVPNVGYLVADRFFYAGDAFTLPEAPVEVKGQPERLSRHPPCKPECPRLRSRVGRRRRCVRDGLCGRCE